MSEPYYQDDWATIYHGKAQEIVPCLYPDIADRPAAIIMDPPYGGSWKKGENKKAGSRAHAGIAYDTDTGARDWILDRFSGVPAAVFGSFYEPFPKNLLQLLVWKKPADAGVVGSSTGFRRDVEAVFLVGRWPVRTCRASSVLTSIIPNIGNPSSPAGKWGHPHSKPVDLMAQLIELAPPGVILDPFAGSGSTLYAAKATGHHSIGIELEERYCEIAAKRLAQEVLDFGGAA